MAINKKADSKKSEMTEKAKKNAKAAEPKKAFANGSDEQKRAELIEKGFHPTAVAFLKKELGIDLNSLPLNTVYDIKAGRVTEPLTVRVTPLVYDRSTKTAKEMPPIQSVSSMRFVFPYDKNFNPVALDKEHKVFVASYPCHEYIQKAEPSLNVTAEENAPAAAVQKELPKFTQEQIMALEGIGINENRLYGSAFNALDVETKRDILDGNVFSVDGYVRTSFGVLNVSGVGKLVEGPDGTARAKFQAQEPVTLDKDSILDIASVRKMGNLELDFFERDANGKMKTDVYDLPILNQAGKDLVNYGVSFEPVDGYLHKMEYDAKERKFKDVVQKDKYQVSVVNGGLCATKMRKVNDLDQDGNQIKTKFNGKEVDKYHYEATDVRLNADGTVKVGNQDLKFKTKQDLENYKRGKGGVVEGAKWLSYSEKGGKPKEVKYDAFIVPDNQKNGFAKAFSPSTSQKLIEKNQTKIMKAPKRKQNFSLGGF